MMALAASDLRAIVAFLANAASIHAPVPFTRELLDQLAALVGCQFALYNEFDFARREVVAYIPCSAEDSTVRDSFERDPEEGWDELVADLATDRGVEHDGIVTSSDKLPREQRLRYEGVQGYFEAFGIVDQMCVRIGPPGARFVLERCDRDFNERDRMLMRELQPHLLGSWRRASLERRLRIALMALDDDEAEGVMFLSPARDVEFASASARRLLETHFEHAVPLPARISEWLETGSDTPLTLQDGSTALVVTALDAGSTLLLREQPVGRSLLTRREMEVMRCVAAGLRNDEIARRLWIEVPTVRKHLEHVFHKLGVRNRTAAVAALRLRPKASASLS